MANLRDEVVAVKRFRDRFKEFLDEEVGTSLTLDAVQSEEERHEPERVLLRNGGYSPLAKLRKELRSIWTTPGLKDREWKIFLFRADPTVTVSFASTIGRPAATPFQQAAIHLFKCAATMSVCQNKQCPAPYFFAKRKSQKYCASVCASPAQRKQKRRWWQLHGEKWRKQRACVVSPERGLTRKTRR